MGQFSVAEGKGMSAMIHAGEQSPDPGDPKHARRADILVAFSIAVVIVVAALVLFW